LIEARLAFFGCEDEPSVLHEAGHPLHVELPRELPNGGALSARIGLQNVQIGVWFGGILRRPLGSRIIERAPVEVAAGRREHDALYAVRSRRAEGRIKV